MRNQILILAILIFVCGCFQISQATVIKEASGITRVGSDLLIVGDAENGAYYRFPLQKVKGPRIPIDSSQVQRIPLASGQVAIDLESIDLLADGRIAVLAERLHALVGDKGIIVDYDNPLTEFGNRGLEGLAVRPMGKADSHIAVLWEGGYPEYYDVPTPLQESVGRMALQPFVWLHTLPDGESGVEIKMKKEVRQKYSVKEIPLQVPHPAGTEPDAQRFRAPDLVWYQWHEWGKTDWGFVVLLSSQNSPESKDEKTKYGHYCLQRFTAEGAALPGMLDLNTILPSDLQGANWEGLGWFEVGKTLVMIYDKYPKGPLNAYLIDIPDDWVNGKAFTHFVKHETAYYLTGPQQATSPDGTLVTGTKARLIQHAGSHSLVEAEGNIRGYVVTESLQLLCLD